MWASNGITTAGVVVAVLDSVELDAEASCDVVGVAASRTATTAATGECLQIEHATSRCWPSWTTVLELEAVLASIRVGEGSECFN